MIYIGFHMGTWLDGKKKVVEIDPIWDEKGDLAVATGADAATRLPVGTSGQVLQVLASEITGLKWDTPSGGGVTVHSDLTNLSYTSSAHTGFEPTVTKGNLTASTPVKLDQTRQVIGGAAVVSLVNDAAAAVTEIDTGALANSDTVIPTSKAVYTLAGTQGNLTASTPVKLDQTRKVIGGAAVVSLVNDAAAAVTEIDTGALANVDTVVPTSKAVTTAIAAAGYAPLASPAFTGIPTAPTAAGGTNTTQIATTAFVTSAPKSLMASELVRKSETTEYSEAGTIYVVKQTFNIPAIYVVGAIIRCKIDLKSSSGGTIYARFAGTTEVSSSNMAYSTISTDITLTSVSQAITLEIRGSAGTTCWAKNFKICCTDVPQQSVW
jgi:hypothetical protein